MTGDPFDHLQWIPAHESPFGVEVLDCRSVAGGFFSATTQPGVGDRYAQQRRTLGHEFVGRTPEDPLSRDCQLRYPHSGATRDGPLFKAASMEDKWDIYLYEGRLLFTRSWTGELLLTAEIRFLETFANIASVTAPGRLFEAEETYPVSAVDFLVRSHLYGLPVAHPLLHVLGRDMRAQAMQSFSQFGRFGIFGAFGDTSQLPVPPHEKRTRDPSPAPEA